MEKPAANKFVPRSFRFLFRSFRYLPRWFPHLSVIRYLLRPPRPLLLIHCTLSIFQVILNSHSFGEWRRVQTADDEERDKNSSHSFSEWRKRANSWWRRHKNSQHSFGEWKKRQEQFTFIRWMKEETRIVHISFGELQKSKTFSWWRRDKNSSHSFEEWRRDKNSSHSFGEWRRENSRRRRSDKMMMERMNEWWLMGFF